MEDVPKPRNLVARSKVTSRDEESVNDALAEGLKGLGRSMTPEDMLSRGVRKVRSLSTVQVSQLVERAVNKTILERTLRVSPEEKKELLEEVQVRMRILLRAQLDLEERRAALRSHRESLVTALEEANENPELDHLLRRRVKKVVEYLDETDRTIHTILGSLDIGVPPGLRPAKPPPPREDPNRRIKQRMMEGIFEANRLHEPPAHRTG